MYQLEAHKVPHVLEGDGIVLVHLIVLLGIGLRRLQSVGVSVMMSEAASGPLAAAADSCEGCAQAK